MVPGDPHKAAGAPSRGHRIGNVTDRLLLLDGHSLAYRAFFALPVENFATTTGQPTNAVYGFTAMLINVLRDEKPTRVAVAFDRSEPTFRHEQYVEYKAGRTKAPDEFRSQISLIFEVLDALGIRHLSAAGYEADDIIATLATQASAAGDDVLIVTGDRDTFQLIDDHVTVLYNSRGVSDMKRYDPASLVEKYGLTPAQYPDFAALRGDPSDNLPSIPGVGEKTATKWIVEFGSLENLVNRVDEVKGKAGDALRENLGNVLRNRQLTQLICDLPAETVGATPDELAPARSDRNTVHDLFDTLQFRVLRDRLYSTFPDGLPGAPAQGAGDTAAKDQELGGFEVDASVLAPGQVAAWLENHGSVERTGLALAGSWTAGMGLATAIALATPDGAGAFIDPTQLTPDDDRALAEWLADERRPKALHDAKGPIHALAQHGWTLKGLSSDTALAAYLALPGQRTFDLADLSLRYLGKELRDAAGGDVQLTLDGSDEQEAATALIWRAVATLDLAAALDEDLEARGATRLLHEVELPLEYVLAEMERIGIAADVDHFAEMSASLYGEVKGAEQAAYAVVGHEFNLGSPKQLQEVLFTELGLKPKTKKIKTGYTTRLRRADQPARQHRSTRCLEHIMHHRDVSKLKSFVDILSLATGDDGRIHTTLQPDGRGDRAPLLEPRPQPAKNIPIQDRARAAASAKWLRGHRPGYETLLTADYSQIELRIMADLSRDEGTAGRTFEVRLARLPRRDRLPGLRRRADRRQSRAAGQDQGDELRPRLRPVRVRPLRPAPDRRRRGPRPDGRLLRGVRRGPRLPPVDRRPGPPRRLHLDDHGPPPVPARPDLRQPAAPGDGRADGAERPDPGLRRRRDQGGHAPRPRPAGRGRPALADAPAGPRRAHLRGRPGRA